jgi:WD40 repeat protein
MGHPVLYLRGNQTRLLTLPAPVNRDGVIPGIPVHDWYGGRPAPHARTWTSQPSRPIRALTGHTKLVSHVAFSPDETLLATGGRPGKKPSGPSLTGISRDGIVR